MSERPGTSARSGSARRRPRADRRATLLPGRGPLAGVPAVAAFVAVIAVFVVAVLVGGTVGGVLLGVLAVAVAVLLAATWARLTPAERVGRVLALALLVGVALVQVLR